MGDTDESDDDESIDNESDKRNDKRNTKDDTRVDGESYVDERGDEGKDLQIACVDER